MPVCFNLYQVAENQRPSDDVEAAAAKLDKEAADLEPHASKSRLEEEADQLKASLGVFIGPEREPVGFVELDRSKPTMEKIYPSLKNKYADAEKRKYDKKDWPSKDECKKFVSRYATGQNFSHSKEYTYIVQRVCQMDVAEASPIVQISPDWFQVPRLVPASQCLSSC